MDLGVFGKIITDELHGTDAEILSELSVAELYAIQNEAREIYRNHPRGSQQAEAAKIASRRITELFTNQGITDAGDIRVGANGNHQVWGSNHIDEPMQPMSYGAANIQSDAPMGSGGTDVSPKVKGAHNASQQPQWGSDFGGDFGAEGLEVSGVD